MLPGEDLIKKGLADIAKGDETIESLLIAIGEPKLRSLGLDLPKGLPSTPEHRLYELLNAQDPRNVHSRYNALIRRLVSFERALSCAK